MLSFSFLFALVVSAGSVEAEAALLLAREPLTRSEIRLLAETDDVRALEILERAFERRLTIRSRLGRFAPPDLVRELAEALRAIERLDPGAAYDRALELLEQVPATCMEQVPADCMEGVVAREVLARQGDISIIREALLRFFEDPERWGRILGEAARSTEDPRLEDFLEMAGPPLETASREFFRTRIERELADSTHEWKLADMIFWAEQNPTLTKARVLSWIPPGSIHEGWVTHLLSVFTESQAGTRLRALAALGWRKAENRASVLIKALRHGDPLVVALAARALGEMRYPKAAAELERLALSPDPLVAAEAVSALVSSRGKDEVFRLVEDMPSWSFRSALSVMESLDGRLERDAAALVRVVGGIAADTDRHRAIRFLAEGDSPVLAELDLESLEVGEIYPYLARSSHQNVRSLVRRASGEAQGPALAALLLSPRATLFEKEEAAKSLGTAWPEAVARGGSRVIEELDRLTLRDSPATTYRDPSSWPEVLEAPAMLDALEWLPGPDARRVLESIGSVAAIQILMKRKDRLHSVSALGRLRRRGAPEVREAAEVALLDLGAPGNLAIMQRHLARPESLRALVPALANAPHAAEVFDSVSSGEQARPDVLAALFAFDQSHASEFRALLTINESTARRRILAAMTLSGRDERLPLFIDLALNDPSKVIRLMAFRAMSEIDLGPSAARIHRSAGDEDLDIRWAAGLALAPTGEDVAMRLLAAEMDPEKARDRAAFRRVLRLLPPEKGRRLLETLFWDGTGNPFTDFLYYTLIGGFPADEQKRVWTLLSEQMDESPFILFMAAGLDLPEAARAVCSRLR